MSLQWQTQHGYISHNHPYIYWNVAAGKVMNWEGGAQAQGKALPVTTLDQKYIIKAWLKLQYFGLQV